MAAISGIYVVTDPGGGQLLREAWAHNVSDRSIVQIREGTGVYLELDGEVGVVTKPGRYPINNTGIWTLFPAVQNILSQGQPTHFNSFFYFDTNPKVYRDLQFTVKNLICRDKDTMQMVTCNPVINVSLRINEPGNFLRIFRGYGLNNDAVSQYMENNISPLIRKELYNRIKSTPIIDINSETIVFQGELDRTLKSLLRDFGLEVRSAQILDLGILSEDIVNMKGYFNEISKQQIKHISEIAEANTVNEIAVSLFGGDVEKAVNYIMMKRALSKDVGMNPLIWKMYDKLT